MHVIRLLMFVTMWPGVAISGGTAAPSVIDAPSVPIHYVDLHDRVEGEIALGAEVPKATSTRFVLIHGFRTPKPAGRRLAEQVGAHILATMPVGGRDALWAVLWDSGAKDSVNFTGAAHRADGLAAPVAAFLEKIIIASHGEPVVVIAHSLGARVALAALNEIPGPGQLDLLVLVQAAVPAASIYNWAGKDIYNSHFDQTHPDPRRRIPWDTPPTRCEFAPALDRAARVLITQSGRDDTLGVFFEVGRQLTAEDCWPLENDPALGRPFDLPPPRRIVFPGTPLPWEDMTRPVVRILHGLDPFDIPEQERFPELREPDAIVDYSFWLSHPDVEFIDLEDLLDVPPADWHSPLHDASGQSLVSAIRERLDPKKQ